MVESPAFAAVDASAFLGALPDPLLHIRTDGGVTLNASAQERLGEPKVGQGWASLFLPDAAATLEAAAVRARAGETVRASIGVVDSVAPALVTLTPDGRGGALLHLCQARDPLNATLEQRVQERTQALAQVTRFSTLLLTAAGEGIFGLDLQGRTTFSNPAASRILGYSIERMIGTEQHALIHHHHEDGRVFPAEACPIWHTLQDGQTRRVEQDVFWHAQGRAVPVAYVVTPTLNDQGAPSGAVVMFQDVTERRRAQQELRDAMAELERSNERLEQFAYVVSHDLQEPLRTLGSYTELLVRRHRGELGERGDQYLEFMQGAVTRMRSLIQDLLAFARVGQSDLPDDTQVLSLKVLALQGAANVEGALQASGGELELHLAHQVLGHPTLLTQLLTNLISNGLKFHRAGEPPHVIVRSRQQGGIVQVSVQDNGIGIAPEHHERVFTIFQRLHERGAFPGNGIGLAICRKIVEHHGGRLWLDSAPGQGSTFTFTLPAAAPSPTP